MRTAERVIETTYASLGVMEKLREHLEPELVLRRELEPAGNERTVRLLTRLAEVDVNNDPAPANEVIELLEPLRDSWKDLVRSSTTAAIPDMPAPMMAIEGWRPSRAHDDSRPSSSCIRTLRYSVSPGCSPRISFPGNAPVAWPSSKIT